MEKKWPGNHAKCRRFRKARYLQSTKSAPYLILPVTFHNSTGFYSKTRVRMAENEPRPTRTQWFVWKPISKTIRITLENGSRTVSWISLGSGNGPEDKQISALKPKDRPGLLETHSKGKEPVVHPSRNVLETLTEEESSSDDDDSEVVWHCEGSGSEERTDEAPIQGILPARATTEVVEASSPRSVVSVTPIEP